MTDATSLPPDAAEAGPIPGGRQPALLAALANLLLPPFGHVLLGRAGRGFALWLAVLVAGVVPFAILVTVPGAVMIGAVAALWLALLVVLPLDAVRLARAWTAGMERKSYQRAPAYVGIALALLVAGAAFRALVRTQAQAFRIPSGGMSPTLHVGDFVMVKKGLLAAGAIRRGDIVVLPYPRDPSARFIKRVVGLGNETLEIRDQHVYVDGRPVDEPYAHHSDSAIEPREFSPRDNLGPITIAPRHVFVMGDERENSNDSRFWGTLPERAIIGRVSVIYWSWDEAKRAPRWDRVGMRP